MKPASWLVFALFAASACSASTNPDTDTDPERGPIGKADLVGSCADSCGFAASVGNCWCDDLCESYGDCCSDKEAICESSFVAFELFRGGFCPPDVNCTSSVELRADGTLLVDRFGELHGSVHTATVSDPLDLSDAIEILTDPELVKLLDGDAACSQPTDIFESMTLETPDGENRAPVTFCDQAPIEAARQVLDKLTNKYLPVKDFVSFKLFNSGFCPPDVDCTASIELDADGSLRVDRAGELGGGIHEATVSAADLEATVAVLTAGALLELLDGSESPCTQPTDVFESMTAVDGSGEHRNTTTFCHLEPISAARTALRDLADAYLPAP